MNFDATLPAKPAPRRRTVLLNASFAVTQVAVNGLLLFFLFRFLYRELGPQKLGLWSVVMATTSLSNLANLGLSASVVKFVAMYNARGEHDKTSLVIQTSALSLGLLFAVVSLAAWSVISWVLSLVLPSQSIAVGRALVPFSLSSMWLVVVSSVFQSALDGHQRIYLRTSLVMIMTAVYVFACLLLVPRFGIYGLAYAQVLQAALVFVVSWIFLKRLMPILPFLPWRWDRRLFGEMVRYGMNFQVMGAVLLLCDPVTKSLLTKFGGLALTGYYEIASRLTKEVRGLITNANQVLVPAIAHLHEREPQTIRKIYMESWRLMIFTSCPIFATLAALSPAISKIMLGRYEADYIVASVLLAIGWQINTLAAPAYFVFAGIGKLRWNTVSHVCMGLLNLGLGLLLGHLYGGRGVVVGWVLSLALGSAIVPVAYHLIEKIPPRTFVLREEIPLILGGGAGAIVCMLLFAVLKDRTAPGTLIGLLAFAQALCTSYFVWQHPTRRRLTGWLVQESIAMRSTQIDLSPRP